MKGRVKSPKTKFGKPIVFFLCLLFFLAGFYISTIFSQSQDAPSLPHGSRILESVEVDSQAMPHGETGDSYIQSIPFQVLSWKPRALYFPRFATPAQCEGIIEMAKSNLKPSTLALRKGETDESTKGTRTSSGTFISASEDDAGILDAIEQKISKVTMIPRTHGEAFNVLRYEIGQKYDSHYDAFNPAEYGPQKSQRVASFLLYLSDVEEGGETMFPFENGAKLGMGFDYRKCTGLKVKPRQGDGLLFYSVFPNGTIDQVYHLIEGVICQVCKNILSKANNLFQC
ncbi:probable prolyl 4-hydroxylase 9 isoform X2 [Ziziphus jujuba]|uniref:Probable prolyl 4-hydroxylase 9 isoform X2 n=1 Tax=Ziziphus jujuba TaxID=326968 RepID=A0ABM3IX51_ZIZJJ|nr:probable prolyl 4-hydroxylase 9 isoform X2 [Ziziphus jujuba]